MARRLNTDAEIDAFLLKVKQEADHHAPNVKSAIRPLAALVRSRLSLGRDKVEVYERNGVLARTCWVTLKGKRYVFSYNYGSGKIDLRQGTTQGAVLVQIDNQTTLDDVDLAVENL